MTEHRKAVQADEALLRQNAQNYHDGRIDHVELTRSNTEIWDRAKRLGYQAALLKAVTQ